MTSKEKVIQIIRKNIKENNDLIEKYENELKKDFEGSQEWIDHAKLCSFYKGYARGLRCAFVFVQCITESEVNV